MENLSIVGFNFAQVECGPVFDVITVRFSARAHDYRVDAASGANYGYAETTDIPLLPIGEEQPPGEALAPEDEQQEPAA